VKKIIYILIIAVSISFNANSASSSEGKWYKFTDDFIKNCFDGFEETQEGVNETAGKTSSFANSLTRKDLADCLPSVPYLDTDPQVDPIDFGGSGSCEATYVTSEFINLPSASNGQTVELTSTNGKITAKYKCNDGSWGSSFDKIDIKVSELSCSSSCFVWDSEGNITSCSSASKVIGNVNVCGNLVSLTNHGKQIKLNAGSNYYKGSAQLFCNNGSWTLVDGSASCGSLYCETNPDLNKTSWSDKEIISSNVYGTLEEMSEKEDYDSDILNELKEQLSILSAEGKDTTIIVNRILDLEINTAEKSSSTSDSPINSEKKEEIKCVSSISTMDGKVGFGIYQNLDRRIFKTEEYAIENHQNVIGEASFSCNKGKWIVNGLTSVCKRDNTVDCSKTRVVSKKDGENVLGYYCE
jgi:hypothetical protein